MRGQILRIVRYILLLLIQTSIQRNCKSRDVLMRRTTEQEPFAYPCLEIVAVPEPTLI